MPTYEDRAAFKQAIREKDSVKIRELLQRDDAKELLLMKDDYGDLPIYDACSYTSLDRASFQTILDAAVEHAIAKQMLEAKTERGSTCLHVACCNDLSANSFHLLLEYLSKHANRMLGEKNNEGWTCIHYACRFDLFTDTLRLLLEHLAKHADIKRVLEEKTSTRSTCLHFACANKMSPDSLRLLLEYSSKHADIKKMLEEKSNQGRTCLHFACDNDLSVDSFRLLVSFFPSNESLQLVLDSNNNDDKTPLAVARNDEHKQLLQDPDCWRKCRYWLFCNYQETFLNSLYPSSPEKTFEALKELAKKYADDETLKKAIANLEATDNRNDDQLSALRKENEELKKRVEGLEQENKQVKEERVLLMKQLYAGFG